MTREKLEVKMQGLLADARPALGAGWQEEALSAMRATQARKSRPRLAYAAGLAAIVGLVAVGVWLRPSPPPSRIVMKSNGGRVATPVTISKGPVQSASAAEVGGGARRWSAPVEWCWCRSRGLFRRRR